MKTIISSACSFLIIGLVFFTTSSYAQDRRSELCNINAVLPSEYTVNNDGTLAHHETGLMWYRCYGNSSFENGQCSSPEIQTFPEALAYAEQVSWAGYSDWRIPNAKEIMSIIDSPCDTPAAESVRDDFFAISGADGIRSWTTTFDYVDYVLTAYIPRELYGGYEINFSLDAVGWTALKGEDQFGNVHESPPSEGFFLLVRDIKADE